MPEADRQIGIKVGLETNGIDSDMQKIQGTLSKQMESLQRQSIIVEKLTAIYESLYQKA